MHTRIIRLLPLILLSGGIALGQDAEIEAEPLAAEEDRQTAIDKLEPAVSTNSDAAGPFEPDESADELTVAAAPSGGPQAIDRLDLAASEITGNQELPKVLYIVPWRPSSPGDLSGRPANSLLDDVLAPVDRGEFVREVDYYSDLFTEAEPE